MTEISLDNCETCLNKEINDEKSNGEKKSVFKVYFWKFMLVSGVFLGFSVLFEYRLIVIGAPLVDIFISQLAAIGAILLACHDVFFAAVGEVKDKRLGASLLMIIAAIGAILISEATEGAMALFLYSVAEKLEDISADKARDAVSKLMELTPNVALVRVDGMIREMPTIDVKVGDVIVVQPGMKVPLDGIILAGESYFDTHAITGESVPRLKVPGDGIYASSINGDNLVDIKVTTAPNDTLMARIAASIRLAQANKSKTEAFIQKFASYYTPAILVFSVLLMAIPWLVFNQQPLPWVYRGLILLVISCPCALTLSTPLSMVAALTKLSREGILVKGGRFIEELEHVKMFGFDKTATLTEGRLRLYDNVPFEGGLTEEENLQLIASLEANSHHPIAKAILNGAKHVKLLPVQEFSEVKGKGITGYINGFNYVVGSASYLRELGIPVPETELDEYMEDGKTPVLLAGDGEYLGMITVRDNLRLSAPILLRGLKHRNIKSMILSGDMQATVDSIGNCLYIDERYGNLLPEQKMEKIKDIQEHGLEVSMVGDGINDAPALTQSNVGIAMGKSGTDIALESADITIMNDDLTKILVLLDIKRITNRIIKENIWLSIIIKVSFAVLTVLGFMTLAIAVGIGDMGVSLFVILNGYRVFRYRSQFQDISAQDLEVEATQIICNTCKTCLTYPQHHGREMIKQDGGLVCWKSLVAEVSADVCKEKLSLKCPTCNGTLEIK